ncbi:MAG TPA: tellurite resistance TerB family protein [Pirellulales bacterium]|jgi:uncharacterized membrane protein YebE (DUF533 family)|nr:tellurite resistance TerB family protein [Pirellulales bacterium]
MANTKDLLGALLGRGMTDSSARRVENALGEDGIGGIGGILEQLGIAPAKVPVGAQTKSQAGASNEPDLLGKLGSIAKSMLGEGGQGKPLAAGGLGALVGAILGGGQKSAKGAIGGGALALLGSIALQALRASQQKSQPQEIDHAARLAAGLREPENAHEEKQLESIVDLTVKAMINAAKADGHIDEDEMQKVVGELQSDGVSEAEREYLLAEVRKPMCTDELVRAVPNRQVAAQVYTASLLAIEVDTPTEKAYMQELARDLNLDSKVVNQIHATLGLA